MANNDKQAVLDRLKYYMWKTCNPFTCETYDALDVNRLLKATDYYICMAGLVYQELTEEATTLRYAQINNEGESPLYYADHDMCIKYLRTDGVNRILKYIQDSTPNSEKFKNLIDSHKKAFVKAFPKRSKYADKYYYYDLADMLARDLLYSALQTKNKKQRNHLVNDYFIIAKEVAKITYEAIIKDYTTQPCSNSLSHNNKPPLKCIINI